MTATSKQEPPIPADDPVAEVVADEAEETEAQQATRRGKKPVTASVATVPAAAVEPAAKAAKAKPARHHADHPRDPRRHRQGPRPLPTSSKESTPGQRDLSRGDALEIEPCQVRRGSLRT